MVILAFIHKKMPLNNYLNYRLSLCSVYINLEIKCEIITI